MRTHPLSGHIYERFKDASDFDIVDVETALAGTAFSADESRKAYRLVAVDLMHCMVQEKVARLLKTGTKAKPFQSGALFTVQKETP